jgi:glycosyltransferase involved in cell wall biosynthesis
MAAGVPVVAGAYVRDELGVKATEALQVSESAVDFGLRIIQLLEDATLRAELGARGRAYVSAHHAWSVLTPKLSEIVEGLAKPEWARERLTPAAVDPRAPMQGGDQ